MLRAEATSIAVALLPVLGILGCLGGIETKTFPSLGTALEGLAASSGTVSLSCEGGGGAVVPSRSGATIPGRARRVKWLGDCSGMLTEPVNDGSSVIVSAS